MAFSHPDLPYAHDALASKGMSKETLEYHHDIHHNAYVTNGNKAIEGTEWEGKSLEEIIKGTYDPKAVAQSGIFNNISQLWNHNQFWEMMSPEDNAMPGELVGWVVEKAQQREEIARQREEIAELKAEDLNAGSPEAAMKIIAGTARSMGLDVEGVE